MFLYKLAALVTLPLLVWQGKKVRAKALKLPEAEGARRSPSSHSPSILIIGDSSAAGVGAKTQQQALLGFILKYINTGQDIHWQLAAKSGIQTKQMRAFLAEELECSAHFDHVIISLGVNDVTALISSQKRLESLQELCVFCSEQYHAKNIIISGMPPMHKFPLLPQPLRYVLGARAKDFDRQQRAMIQRGSKQTANLHYVPLDFTLEIDAMAQDGFHPGPRIYEEWAKSIVDILHRFPANK